MEQHPMVTAGICACVWACGFFICKERFDRQLITFAVCGNIVLGLLFSIGY